MKRSRSFVQVLLCGRVVGGVRQLAGIVLPHGHHGGWRREVLSVGAQTIEDELARATACTLQRTHAAPLGIDFSRGYGSGGDSVFEESSRQSCNQQRIIIHHNKSTSLIIVHPKVCINQPLPSIGILSACFLHHKNGFRHTPTAYALKYQAIDISGHRDSQVFSKTCFCQTTAIELTCTVA